METLRDKMLNEVTIVRHVVGQAALTKLRDVKTENGRRGFAQASDQAASFLAAEVTRDIITTGIEVQTPLGSARGHRIEAKVTLVPILRAGLALQAPFWDLLPQACIQHIGTERNEGTAEPMRYYPHDTMKTLLIDQNTYVILLDPMLATGGSACDALAEIMKYRPREVRFASIIAAPEGIARVKNEYKYVRIYTLTVDNRLNDNKFIVPGLGDYGDRYFNTVRSMETSIAA